MANGASAWGALPTTRSERVARNRRVPPPEQKIKTMDQRQLIEELVYRSCLALDEQDFKGFLELCDESFRYSVTAFSPEIRKDMTWLDHDKAGMDTLFANLPRHNSDHSPLTRHVTVY